MLMEQVETSVLRLMFSSWAKRKNEVSMPCVRKTVTTPAMEYQSTKGADSAGENALVMMGAMRKGNILTSTELMP